MTLCSDAAIGYGRRHERAHNHAAHPDSPAAPATAAAVVKKVGLTEREAQAILASDDHTEDEVAQALRVNIHAISAAFSEPTFAYHHAGHPGHRGHAHDAASAQPAVKPSPA